MNKDFLKVYYKFPKLLTGFVKIQKSTNTIRLAMQAVAEVLQEEINLYYVLVRAVERDFLVVDSAFGTNKNDIQRYLNHLPPPIEISKSTFASNLISSGKLWVDTLDVKPVFCSTPLPQTASLIFLPVTRNNKVFCIIELGSEKIISHIQYWNNPYISRVLKLPFEMLMLKINQIANSKSEED
jgi:hypothetical protein